MNFRISISMGLLVCALVTTRALADRTVQWLDGTNVTTYSPADETLGDYFYLSVEIPEGVDANKLLGATLELYFDVDVRAVSAEVDGERVDFRAPASFVQAYPLTAAWTGELDERTLDHAGSVRVPVLLGENRLVRIDITRIIRRFIRDPSANRGIVIGSLTSSRSGILSLRDTFGAEGKARIVYVR